VNLEPQLPPYRVGFNALLLSLTSDHRAAGIHRYIAALLERLGSADGLAVTAFTAEPRAREALPADVAIVRAPRWASIAGRAGRIAWEQIGLPRAIARARCNLFHSAAYAMPAACPVPAIVTVHDLSFFRIPDAFPARQAAYLRAATRLSARRAAAIIAVSDFTRRELLELTSARPERVHVIPNGVDEDMRAPSPARLAAWRAERGLPERFVLSVGTLQPRKNVSTLLRAFARLLADWTDELGTAPELVLAGAAGWGGVDPVDEARRLGIERSVRAVGFVPAGELPFWYAAADIMALPSRYEGFGLPALEAMACGTPVVVSAATSLTEVVGPAGLSVQATDAEAWAESLRRLLANPAQATALSAAGRARAAGFTWQRTATETANLYRGVLRAERTARPGGTVARETEAYHRRA